MPVLLQHGLPTRAARFDRIDLQSSIVVVPTRRRIRHLSRELITQFPGGGASSPMLFTLETLATRFFSCLWPGRSVVNTAMQSLLIHRAILARRKQLKYFVPREGTTPLQRGTFDKIINVLNALKESGVYPETLEEEIGQAEHDERQKLNDIIQIYKAYENELEIVSSVDVGGIYRLLHVHCSQEQLALAAEQLFPSVHSVFLAGFDEFTEPEIGFIRKISQLHDITVSMIFDYLPGNASLFGHLEENYHRFLGLGFDERPSISSSGFLFFGNDKQSTGSRTHTDDVAKHLFNKASRPNRIELRGKATIIAAKDRAEEVRSVCRILKQVMLTDPGRDPSRICVAMRHPEKYTHLFREASAEFGIPLNITDRFRLASAPPVVAMLGLLQIPMRGYKRDDVLRVAGSPYLSLHSGASKVDSSNLTAVSGRLRILGGYNSWLAAIKKQEERLRYATANVADRFQLAMIDRELRSLAQAHKDIETLGSLLQPFHSALTPRAFLHGVQSLITRLNVLKNLVGTSTAESADVVEKGVRAFSRFTTVLEETISLLQYQEGRETKHTLKRYVEYLRVAIANERYNVRERFGHGVLVTSIEETRGLPMDIMVLIGLVDGEFPSVYHPEVFYSIARQKKRAQRHIWEQRYLFYQAITNWSDHLYLTFPEQDGELETVRSTFVDAFTDIAEVDVWKESKLPPILSANEYMRLCGEAFGNGQAMPAPVAGMPAGQQHALGKAIVVEKERIERNPHSPYGGHIFEAISEEGRARLQRLPEAVYSVSQLESYAKCPYQFFSSRVLRLQNLEDLEEELTPRERGSVLHEILFEFYTSRVAHGLPPLQGCNDATYQEALDDLLMLANNKLGAMDIPDPFWEVEKELLVGRSVGDKCLLTEFLEHERKRKVDVVPSYFEVAFGPKVRQGTNADPVLSSAEEVMAGEVKLRGKIDRIEANDEVFVVVDYKTGRKLPDLEEIRRGLSLQLPLYLHAVEQLLERQLHKKLAPAAGLYYQLRDSVAMKFGIASGEHRNEAFEAGPRTTRNILESDAHLRALIDEAISLINGHVRNIAAGAFPLTTPDKMDEVCGFCNFKTICRVQSVHQVIVKEDQT